MNAPTLPRVGMRFRHARVLDAANRPAVYVVTAVRQGLVYYKQDGERKAKEYTTLDQWARVYGGPA